MKREDSSNNNKQHFSHKHILTRLQLDEVEEITCNAGECAAEEEQFYGCTDCKYFLHEKCAEAPRSIEHRSHPSHPLTLHAAPTYSNQSFIFNACGHVGYGFCYSCAHCSFDLHLLCSTWPHNIFSEEEHPHELQLVCEQEKLLTANMIFVCFLCDAVNTECWIYYCETCNFGFHLHCQISQLLEGSEGSEEEEEEKEEERENEETANPEISAGSDNEEYFSLSPSSSSSGRGINEPNSRAKTRQELEQAILESLRGMARLAQKLVVDLLNAAADYVPSR